MGDASNKKKSSPRKSLRLAWAGIVVGLAALLLYVPRSSWFVILSFVLGIQLPNEAGATQVMEQMRTSINKFSQMNGGYPASLQDLVADGLLPRELASKVIHNYEFEYVAQKPFLVGKDDRRLCLRFYVAARPRVPHPGARTIVLIERGEIGIYDSTRADMRVDSVIKAPDDWGFQKKPDI